MLSIRSLDLVDSNITQTLTGWTYFLHFPVTGRVARAFSGVFYIGSNREIHPLEPQRHRHSMLAPRVCAPRVTRCSLGHVI